MPGHTSGQRSRILTGRLFAPYSAAHSASSVSLPLLVFGECTAGFANPGPGGQDRPSVQHPAFVYRGRLVVQRRPLVLSLLFGRTGSRTRQKRPAPQRRRRGKALTQLKREG